MDISLYIAELLRQHNAVNVPTLGTFYKRKKAGYYDPQKGMFFPPEFTLFFTVEDDGETLLADHISRQKNVSANTALYFIEKFVSYIKTLLDLNGHADIESVGTLTETSKGYSFISSINFDSDGNHFGLLPVEELAEVLKETPVTVSLPADEQSENPSQPETSNTAVEQPAEEVLAEESSSRKLSTSGMVLLLTGFLILAGIMGYLTFPEAFEGFNQQTAIPKQNIPVKKPLVAAVPMSLEDSLIQADTIYQELSKQGFEIDKPRDTLEVTTTVSTTAPADDAVSFEIIGAAFARRTEAETYVKQLQNKGVYAKIVENMPGSKLKISLGTFNDENSAKKELSRIKADINKDAWIARVKPKKTK